jgi:hypothetical protein
VVNKAARISSLAAREPRKIKAVAVLRVIGGLGEAGARRLGPAKPLPPRRPTLSVGIVNEKRAESLFLTLAMERNQIYVVLVEFLNTRWGEPGGQQNSIARRLGAAG